MSRQGTCGVLKCEHETHNCRWRNLWTEWRQVDLKSKKETEAVLEGEIVENDVMVEMSPSFSSQTVVRRAVLGMLRVVDAGERKD